MTWLSRFPNAARRGWSLVLSVKHLRGVINSDTVQGASRRGESMSWKNWRLNSPLMFSQGEGAPDLVPRGSSISVTTRREPVAASNHIAIVRVIVANALLWGNKPITEQTAGLVVVASGCVGASRLKTSNPRRKGGRSVGRRSCELTEIVPIQLGTGHLNSTSDEFREKIPPRPLRFLRSVCSDATTFISVVEIE